ncbi:MAG: heme-binding protein [Rhodospirillales bacterium]|nr:heme-binding protein [Acetobacter sp.]
MTAPMGESRSGKERWTIRFFMPRSYTRETLPEPTNSAVRIVTKPPETFGVLRFTGLPAPHAVAGQQARLLSILAGSAWQQDGAPVAWFYDPPWTIPFLRRNEVAVRVLPRPP